MQSDLIIASYLKSRGFKQTENALRNEAKLTSDTPVDTGIILHLLNEPISVTNCEPSYRQLRNWIHDSIDKYKAQLSTILYPLFVHIYLILVQSNTPDLAKSFLDLHKSDHIDGHKPDILKLSSIQNSQQVSENEFVQIIRNKKTSVNMSSYTFELLLSYLQEKKFVSLLKIINEHIHINVVEVSTAETAVVPSEDIEQEEIKLGRLPPDSWLVAEIERTLNDSGDSSLLPIFESMKDPKDGPARDSIPTIPSRMADIKSEIEALEDIKNRISLGVNILPSICSYTFHNTYESLNCASVSENASFIAAGFQDSVIRLWNNHINAASSESATTIKLIGHSGPVYKTCFDSKSQYLASSSEDGTIRLWSMQTFTNLVAYRGHSYPIWDIDFSPFGLYFASASYDKTARLWSTDQIYPLRLFVGHDSDVNCVKFHPNSNYILTGSSDYTLRLWSVQTGKCVRLLKGHNDAVTTVAISPDGKHAVSGGLDKKIITWDLASGKSISVHTGHESTSLDFDRNGAVFASGGLDGVVRLYDVKDGLHLKTFYSKNTKVIGVKFGVRNLMYTMGVYM